MASATMSDTRSRWASDTIKLEYGVPQVFALKYLTGKPVESRFPGGRVLFSTSRGSLFLNDEDASDFERGVREIAPAAGEEVRVVMVKHAHGGGHSIRVALASEAAEPTHTEALLEKSVEMARNGQREGFRAAAMQATTAPVTYAFKENQNAEVPAAVQSFNGSPLITPQSAKLCAVMCSLIDAMTEAKTYSVRRGLDLTTEDLRALVVTAFIQASREGGR